MAAASVKYTDVSDRIMPRLQSSIENIFLLKREKITFFLRQILTCMIFCCENS